jgi:CheY-like chemotaxis protein
MTRLLLESDLNNEQQQLASIAFRSSTNLLEIVNDILDLSKIEAGEIQLECIGMSLTYILTGVTQALEQLAREKHLRLILDYDNAEFPYVMGDPTRVTWVLTNLVGNAIKYTERGTVTIRARCLPADNAQVTFRCDVADTGIGIPANKLETIFDKFVQADTSTTRKYGGTGLGLAITKQLVELMGGTIGVQSAVGCGSTFWFSIPFKVTGTLGERKNRRSKRILSGTIPCAKARILVAEDHPMNQILISKLLTRFGIGHFQIVEDGASVVAESQAASWDIVLMDCHMPAMNGYDATLTIRQSEKQSGIHVPIVAMTANAMVGDREKCLRTGMDDYISKPIAIDELKEVLAQWISFENSHHVPNEHADAKSGPASLDLSVLRDFSEGDRDTENALVEAFITQSDKNIAMLDENRHGKSSDAWIEAAHMLKGGAAGIGAQTLSELCKEAQHFRGTASRLKSGLRGS